MLPLEVQRLDRDHEAVAYGVHSHDFYSIYLFTRGGGHHDVDGVSHAVARGDLWLLRPGVVHDLGAIGAAEGWTIVVGAEALGLPPWAQDFGRPWRYPLAAGFHGVDESGRPHRHRLAGADVATWESLLTSLTQELSEARPAQHDAVRALLHLLLIHASRLGPPAARPPAPDIVDRAFDKVDQDFASGLSLADVARYVNVSPGHLTEIVRRSTGLPLGEWIIQRRLVEARRLLVETGEPVGVVAERCGYADVGHFRRQFEKRHGRSPSAWRDAVLGATDRPPLSEDRT